MSIPALKVFKATYPIPKCLYPDSDSAVGCDLRKLRRSIAVELPRAIAADGSAVATQQQSHHNVVAC